MSQWTGAVSTDWNDPLNWTVGGTGTGVPSATVDAIFTGNPTRPCTTGATTRTCRNLITTGFTGANAVLTIGTTTTANLNVVGTTITFGTSTNHLDPTNSQGLISIQTTGTTITSASAAVIVPGITNAGFSYTINLVGTISAKRFVPGGNATFNSATAGTFIDIVTGGSIQGGGGPGTNVTLRINGSCAINAAGFSTKGNFVLASGSTLTMNGILDANNATASFDFSAGTLIPNVNLFRVQNSSIVTINLGSNSFYDVQLNGTITLASNMNITNNFTPQILTINGAFDITVGGNITGGSITAVTTAAGRKVRLTGTSTGTSTVGTVGNVTMAGPAVGGYKLEIDCGINGFVMNNLFTSTNITIDYLTSNTGSFSATTSTLSYTGNLTINMNGKGSTYVFGTLQNTSGNGRILTLLSDVYFNTIGNTSFNDTYNGLFNLNVFGNVGPMNGISGTATLRFIGNTPSTFTTASAVTVIGINITTDKTGGAAVTFPLAFTWGAANRTLNLNTSANFATNSTILTLTGTPLTILNASNSQFWNLTTAAGAQTINLN